MTGRSAGRRGGHADRQGLPTVVSTFAGGGGSSLGYKDAGYSELLAIDFDDHSEEVFKLNFPGVPFWNRDIRGVMPEEVLEFIGLERGQLFCLDGSPPCQGFSTSGRRRVSDSRNDLFTDFCRLLKGIQPVVFVMENVPGMARGKMKGVFSDAFRALEACGYVVKCRMLNAANYGVPQSRQRLFFIGVRADLEAEPVFPEPQGDVITVRKALDGVPSDGEVRVFSGKHKGLMLLTRRGQRVADFHPKKHMFNFRRLLWDRPAYTVVKMFSDRRSGFAHPDHDRFLTIPELKRICSFPDDFKLTGSFEQQWATLGNAVMPLQMKAVALKLRERFFDKKKQEVETT